MINMKKMTIVALTICGTEEIIAETSDFKRGIAFKLRKGRSTRRVRNIVTFGINGRIAAGRIQ